MIPAGVFLTRLPSVAVRRGRRRRCVVVNRAVKERRALPRLKKEALDLGTGKRRPPVTRLMASPDVKTRQTVLKNRGEGGFRKATVTTTTTNTDGDILWEEVWWDASDWNGLKELGAEKKGKEGNGKSWTEDWIEKMYFDSPLQCHVIHKTCRKWCKDTKAEEEWEETWEEYFVKDGMSKRWSKKWGKRGVQVWHENWGDELDSEGNGNLWTDKWYEDVFDGEGVVHWGEKWQAVLERKCEMSKRGENWRRGWKNGEEETYHRWWKESKSRSDDTLSKSGHSTSGEHWDTTEDIEEVDFAPVVQTNRYEIAVDASPQLQAVPITPRT